MDKREYWKKTYVQYKGNFSLLYIPKRKASHRLHLCDRYYSLSAECGSAVYLSIGKPLHFPLVSETKVRSQEKMKKISRQRAKKSAFR